MSNAEPLADTRDMHTVHTVFRRELGMAPELVRGVADGDTVRSGVVADHIELMLNTLGTHHRGEDVHLWPRLLERAPQATPIVHNMEAQHHAIDAAHTEIVVGVRAWRADAGHEAREWLATTLDGFVPLLDQHLRLEEEEAVPLIGAYITAREWNAMVQEGGADLSPEVAPVLFGMLMYEADPEVVKLSVDNMPPEIQPVIRDIASQAYAAYATNLYGTPTPPRATDRRP